MKKLVIICMSVCLIVAVGIKALQPVDNIPAPNGSAIAEPI